MGGPQSDNLLPGPCSDRALHARCTWSLLLQTGLLGPGAKSGKNSPEPRTTPSGRFQRDDSPHCPQLWFPLGNTFWNIARLLCMVLSVWREPYNIL